MKIAVGVMACLLLVAGCGSGGDDAAPATVTVEASSSRAMTSASPAPSPSPSLLTKAEAAAKYNEVRAPYADSVTAFNTLYDGNSTDVAAWNAACGDTAGGYDGWARDLAAVPNWPADAQDEIDALVAALGTSRGFYVQCQQATDMSQVYDAIGRRTGELAGAVQNAKVVLGVPSS